MLHTIAQKAVNTGFTDAEALADDTGAYSYRLSFDGETFYLVTKEYAFKGLASFMEDVVEQAADEGGLLLFYEDDEETTRVFDAEYVQSFGRPSLGRSKTRDTAWVEIDLTEGCLLADYLNGDGRPATLAGENDTLASF